MTRGGCQGNLTRGGCHVPRPRDFQNFQKFQNRPKVVEKRPKVKKKLKFSFRRPYGDPFSNLANFEGPQPPGRPGLKAVLSVFSHNLAYFGPPKHTVLAYFGLCADTEVQNRAAKGVKIAFLMEFTPSKAQF